MSITKTEHWDFFVKQHEEFMKQVRQSGYPVWIYDMYETPKIEECHTTDILPEAPQQS